MATNGANGTNGVNGVYGIPVVDLSPFTTGGDLESRKRAARELFDKGHVNGSVGISGHGLSDAALKEAFQLTKKLFDLPHEDKMKAPHPDAAVPHRGYTAIGREQGGAKTALQDADEETKAAFEKMGDFKESYEIGSEENKIQYNIWLPEDVFPGFRQQTTDLFWTLNKTANAILDALILSLELTEKEADTLRALHNGHENQLRLLHYPPIPKDMLKNKGLTRLDAHTDWSSFTLLFQDDHSGLEFQDIKSGEFMPATPKEGVLYMNIGDMFQRASNGYYPSSTHRVSISGKADEKSTPERYSIPYFVVPVPDGVIEPPASLVQKLGKQVYEPVTFTEYSNRMFAHINIHDK